MDTLSVHAKEVLSAFAAATGPLDADEVVESLLPEAAVIRCPNCRRQAYRAWLRRRRELQHAANMLEVDGLLVTVPDISGLVIGESGRSALAGAVGD